MSTMCASDQHYPAINRVTSSGSSPSFYVSLYICLIDPSVIRRDGFPVRKARRWARRPRESFEALVKN
ncbi:hypothetical protein ALC53_01388 [Atta colombica]|uniref:Uncharacterized protein n=1 Tax=Atta colombica TaxID=520822 RepID=A0A195BUX9_9HYME|nr:hypothetical protein ALC53_01388 [Atta colombica]